MTLSTNDSGEHVELWRTFFCNSLVFSMAGSKSSIQDVLGKLLFCNVLAVCSNIPFPPNAGLDRDISAELTVAEFFYILTIFSDS